MKTAQGGFQKRSRVVILICIIVAVILCYYYRLMQLQIVNGAYYSALAESSFSSSSAILAARGEIIDRNGRPYAVNTIGYNIVFQRNFLPKETENQTILELASLLSASDEKWNDTLPISKNAPFIFNEGEEAAAEALKTKLRLNSYATAENCLDALYQKYSLAESDYTAEQKRLIAGVRYEMEKREFSSNNDYVFSTGVSVSTAAKFSELSFKYEGVEIVSQSERAYVASTSAPHIIGIVGAMNETEYETYKAQGYKMSDYVGKFGAEQAFESYLKGTDGKRLVTQDKYGNITSVNETVEARPGDTVVLTLDQTLQNGLQEIIAEHFSWLQARGGEGKDVEGISMVVLDVSDGGVLAGANYPSYDLNNYYEDYSELLTAEGNPLFNRFCNGLYRPGSTFETMVSLAGLTEGIINPSSTVTCKHVYDYYDDYQPSCLGHHGAINVMQALGYSCNIFYYDVGRRLGVTKFMEYAALCGYSSKTGIEIGEATGRLAGPETAESLGLSWYNGDTLQAAIGQSETTVTPIQMATAAMTLANNGVRYKTHILKEVRSYDLSQTVYEYEPEVLAKIDASDEVFAAIKQGMINSANSTGSAGLASLKVKAAIKTGTPQVTEKKVNQCMIGYAPADNPQIAFAVMQENGYYTYRLVRNFLEFYFSEKEVTTPDDIGVLLD